MADKPIIDIDDVVKDYDSTRAVDHLDLTIREGEIFGLLGPNGAGKTTLILTLLGLSEPTEGTVKVREFNATTEPISVKRITGYLPDNVGFSDNRTGKQNLIYTALLNGMSRDEAKHAAEELLGTVGLVKAKGQKTKTYSKGMIQRLGVADILIKEPEIIILDEPTTGIDPKGINEFLELIRTLSKEKGITVLLCSHLLHQVQKICDRVGLLVDGRLLALGKINELADKLFQDDQTSITAEIRPVTDQLILDLQQIELLSDVSRENGLLTMKGPKEAAPLISRKVSEHKASLYGLTCREYGLDDIYQHYFEGGVIDE